MAPLESGLRIANTATSSTSAVATLTGVAGTYIYLTDVTGSSDKSGAKILVKDGSTVIWQDVIGTQVYNMSFTTPIRITLGASLTVTVDGTALCNANAAGVQL